MLAANARHVDQRPDRTQIRGGRLCIRTSSYWYPNLYFDRFKTWVQGGLCVYNVARCVVQELPFSQHQETRGRITLAPAALLAAASGYACVRAERRP